MNKHLFIEEPKGEFCELKLTYEELTKMYNKIYKLEQKLQRKDNIINELKVWLKKETIDLYDKDNPMLLDSSFTKYATERKMAYMYILDKIKELEENNENRKCS